MTFWFCGKSWREKQRHKGAQEGGKAQPLVRRQDVGQTLPDRRLLPAVPTPCTVAPAAPGLFFLKNFITQNPVWVAVGGTRADFFLPAASCVGTTRSPITVI